MQDVIAAVSTGSQISAIGILRLSGQGCARIAGQVFALRGGMPLWEAPDRKLMLGTLRDKDGRVIDQGLGVYTRGPGSYTGEDTVELQCHGSPAVLAAGLEALYAAGARPAARGEFTKRAFLNGRMDLTQAEAVIDLIEAETAEAAANAAGQVEGSLRRRLEPLYLGLTDLCSHFHAVLDYPDEEIDEFRLEDYSAVLRDTGSALEALLKTFRRGQILRRGLRVALVGKPNVGKSSLLNALAGYDRAIVTDIPGTTRDTVEEQLRLGSLRLRLTDTAGIRASSDPVEALGVERSRSAAREAEAVLFVCDGSRSLDGQDREAMAAAEGKWAAALVNKSDLPREADLGELPFRYILPVSARTGAGLDALAGLLEEHFGGSVACDGSILTNARQYDAIRRAWEAVGSALDGLAQGVTPDAVLTDVEAAMDAMGEVTGRTIREDITNRIFERFCVGK